MLTKPIFQRRLTWAVFLCVVAFSSAVAQKPVVSRIDPPNWWEGMKLDTLRLLLYGDHLDDAVVTARGTSVKILRTLGGASPHHLFVDIAIQPTAKPGTVSLTLSHNGSSTSTAFPLLARQRSPRQFQGFSSSDIVYLITPDRFANGDVTNDSVPGMTEGVHRDNAFGRHGGDIQGIIDHLDYLVNLGVTTLWISPLIENNNPRQSYHGYAATDLYRIDPRFGSNAQYRELVHRAHALGLKVILDHVANHISIHHPWLSDLPTRTWLNGSVASHAITNHGKTALMDPHGDSSTVRNLLDGWFTNEMPDLNQRDPSLAAYIIQNTIWWIESAGLDGIREDTYPYVQPEFWPRWCNAILREYPELNILGEVWVGEPAYLAPFQRGSALVPSLHPSLPVLTDFALFDEINRVFGGHQSIYRIYECLGKDYLYANPDNLLTFVDNHDVKRVMAALREDTARVRLALTLLLTTRGIPAIYYGTEIGIKGGDNDGTVRADFPGGFPLDERDCFTVQGRSAAQEELYVFVQRLIQLRKTHTALSQGRLVQFNPTHEVYCYIRENENERILVSMNSGTESQTVDLAKVMGTDHPPLIEMDLMTGKRVDPSSIFILPANDSRVYLLAPSAALPRH
ncbi:MAG: alpha-amylase family glycosyl hydrolase [Bacteroidota bacterium]